MKRTIVTTATIAGYFMLMSSLGIIASVPARVNNAAKETIRKELSYRITCPDFVTENSDDNVVRAIVRVDDEGTVHVESIASANARLQQYVTAELGKMKIDHPATTEEFVLIIRFRVV